MCLAQTLPLSASALHVAETMFDIACGNASSGSSTILQQDTVDMSLVGNRRCKIRCPYRCVQYRITDGRRILEAALADSKVAYCKDFVVCSGAVSLHLLAPDTNLTMLRGAVARMQMRNLLLLDSL